MPALCSHRREQAAHSSRQHRPRQARARHRANGVGPERQTFRWPAAKSHRPSIDRRRDTQREHVADWGCSDGGGRPDRLPAGFERPDMGVAIRFSWFSGKRMRCRRAALIDGCGLKAKRRERARSASERSPRTCEAGIREPRKTPGRYVSGGVTRIFSGGKRTRVPTFLGTFASPTLNVFYAAECKTPAGIAGGRNLAIVLFPIMHLRSLNKDRNRAIEMRSARRRETKIGGSR